MFTCKVRRVLLISLVVVNEILTLNYEKCSEVVDFENCDRVNSDKPINQFGLDESFIMQAKPRAFQNCPSMRTESAEFWIGDPKAGENAPAEYNKKTKFNYVDVKPGMFTTYGVRLVLYEFNGNYDRGISFTAYARCGFAMVYKSPVIEFAGGSNKQDLACDLPIKLRFTVRNTKVPASERSLWSTYVILDSTGEKVSSGNVEQDLIIFPEFIPTCNPKTTYKFVIVIPNRDLMGREKGTKEFSVLRVLTTTGFISIRCILNCKEGQLVNIRQIFTLQMINTNIPVVTTPLWSIEPNLNLAAARQQSNPQTFSLHPNVLDYDTSYTVTVQMGDFTASRTFKTVGKITIGKCTVNPTEGLLGTDFTITCDNYDGVQPLLYELFLRKSKSELNYIQGSYKNTFTAALPQNSATIRVTDAFGNSHEEEITIKLIEEDLEATKNQLSSRIRAASRQQDWKTSIELMSSLSVILTDKNLMTVGNKLEMLRRFGPINQYTDTMIRSGASVVELVQWNNEDDPDDVLLCSGIVLSKLSLHLTYLFGDTHLNFKTNNLTWTSLYLLHVVEKAVKKKVINSLILDMDAHDYQVHLNKMRKGSSELVLGAHKIMQSVLYDSDWANSERTVAYKSAQVDLKINVPETAFALNSIINKLEFPKNFGSQYSEFEKISIAQTSITNLFWWLPNEVNTDNVIVNVLGLKKKRALKMNQPKQSFILKLEASAMNTTYLSGKASFAPDSVRGNARDNYLSVHRLVYAKREGQLLITTNDNVRILVQQGRFPSYEDALEWNSTEKFLSFSLNQPKDLMSLHVYVAVLPAQSGTGPVPYNISLRHVVCEIWNHYSFSDRYCWVILHSHRACYIVFAEKVLH